MICGSACMHLPARSFITKSARLFASFRNQFASADLARKWRARVGRDATPKPVLTMCACASIISTRAAPHICTRMHTRQTHRDSSRALQQNIQINSRNTNTFCGELLLLLLLATYAALLNARARACSNIHTHTYTHTFGSCSDRFWRLVSALQACSLHTHAEHSPQARKRASECCAKSPCCPLHARALAPWH